MISQPSISQLDATRPAPELPWEKAVGGSAPSQTFCMEPASEASGIGSAPGQEPSPLNLLGK